MAAKGPCTLASALLQLAAAIPVIVFLGGNAQAADTAQIVSEPMPFTVDIRGRSYKLDGLMLRPPGPGRFPLALINHGSCGRACRKKRSPDDLRPQAEVFTRWGYATYLLMRRDNGASDGPFAEGFGGCERQKYDQAAHSAANDMVAALTVLTQLPYVDPHRVVAIGQSGGGIGVIALTTKGVAGLKAVINFAGGRGGSCISKGTFVEEKEIAAFRSFGRRSAVPTLWLYTQNDELWGPDRPKAWHRAFTESGGKAEFVALPPNGRRGHAFFYRASTVPIWKPLVSDFLARSLDR